MFFTIMLYSFLKKISFFAWAAIILLLVASCSTKSKLEKRGGYLMDRHVVKTDRPGISKYDLENFAQPKPNRKFLGLFRQGVWIYDAFSGGRESRFKHWVRTRLGAAPVLLDSALVDNSMNSMRVYLNNKGYFGAHLTRQIHYRRTKASVTYNTITPAPFIFGNITYDIADDSLQYFVNKMQANSLLKQGGQYDAYLLRDERERITKELKDIGYYAFSREFIFFEIDTSQVQRKADVKIYIQNRRIQGASATDSLNEMPHIRYFINNVYIYSNQTGMTSDSSFVLDTLAYRPSYDTSGQSNPLFYQIYRERIRVRPEAIARAVFVKPGEPFSQQNINLTYNRIQNLGLSRYVSVAVSPANSAVHGNIPVSSLLDCDVRMIRTPVNMYTIEAEGTNAGGFVGLGGSFNYRNRNIFRGAEILRLKIYGAFEIQPDLVGDGGTNNNLFNSLEGGFETGLDFPGLLTPFRSRQLYQNARAKTSVQIGFNYQERDEYMRYLSSLSMGYEWNSSLTQKHLFSPLDVSSVSISRDSTFSEYLNALEDPRFLIQYTDHLVMAMKYSYIFNNQNVSKRKNFFYFRLNLESAGNVLNLYSNISNSNKDEGGYYSLFGIRYAQYLRGDIDFRYFRVLDERSQFVYRAAFGIGVPYGNSVALPFEKGFFAGGANGLRGWPVKSLGPGTYSSADGKNFESVGDLWIEANVEYRFPMYSFLNGALFSDIGNVWLLKENQDFPGGNIVSRGFFESLALDAGLGFRLDFSFFIFRIDAGLPVYDPGNEIGKRWVNFPKFQMSNLNWNFGIGYPF